MEGAVPSSGHRSGAEEDERLAGQQSGKAEDTAGHKAIHQRMAGT